MSDHSSSDDDTMDAGQVVTQLETLQSSLSKLEEQLQPLLSQPLQSLTSQLPSIQAAKLQAALAYSLDALFFIYLHTAGESTETHPIKKELDRVKKYLKKIADATDPAAAAAAASSAEKSSATKPNLKLDRDAAKRFISSQLRQQTPEEKADAQTMDESSSENSEDEEVAKANAKATSTTATPSKPTKHNQHPTAPSSNNKRGTDTQKRESNKKAKKQKK